MRDTRTSADVLQLGREAYDRAAWGDAYTQLCAADQEAPLEVDDLERLAMTAYLTRRQDAALEVWGRAHHALMAQGEAGTQRAVRWAFWMGMVLVNQGHHAQAGGWFARAGRLLDDASLDCVERGYLLIPPALQALGGGGHAAAYALFSDQVRIALTVASASSTGRRSCS